MASVMDLLAVVSPSMASLAKPGPNDPSPVKTFLPGVGAGLAGFFAFRKSHPLLGFIGAESLGMNAYRMIRNQGNDRLLASTNLAVTASAVIGSLVMPKRPGPRFVGFVGGLVVGTIATSFMPGSNADSLKRALFGGGR